MCEGGDGGRCEGGGAGIFEGGDGKKSEKFCGSALSNNCEDGPDCVAALVGGSILLCSESCRSMW